MTYRIFVSSVQREFAKAWGLRDLARTLSAPSPAANASPDGRALPLQSADGRTVFGQNDLIYIESNLFEKEKS